MKIRYILYVLAILSVAGWGPFDVFPNTNNASLGSSSWITNEMQAIRSQADNLDETVLKMGLKAYSKARQEGYDHKGLLTIIDFDKVSTERRMWVIDVNREKVLFNTWVAHGRNSGENKATSFSNDPSSLKSSLGVFVTDSSPYIGQHGYSLRLKGLEPGINNNAYSRAIVIHGAWYVGSEVVQRYGRLGRSWGCPAVDQKLAKPLIDTIKNSTLVFVYANDRKWLWKSSFLA
jgi:hypothetical protein